MLVLCPAAAAAVAVVAAIPQPRTEKEGEEVLCPDWFSALYAF